MIAAESGHRRRPIIAIDGPAGAGKTSTAREVARRLGFIHLDTGAMYRAVALKALRYGCDLDIPREIAKMAEKTEVSIRFLHGEQRIFLNGEDVTDQVRLPEVDRAVSPVCEVPRVRARMVKRQRKLGEAGGVVVEGRDIGTVVFPDADLKIYLTADVKERARRRHADQERSGIAVDFDKVAAEVTERDRRDQTRNDSPLKPASDAVLIDTTNLSFEEQVEIVLRHFWARCG